MVNVDPQDLAQKDIGVLAVAVRVACGASIAEAGVEITVIRTKSQYAAIVIREGLVNLKQVFFAPGIGRIAVGLKTRDDRITVLICVIYIEKWSCFKVRMKGQAEQTLLIATASNTVGDIQEGGWENLPVLNDEDAAGLFHYEHAPRTVVNKLNADG